MYNYVSSRIFTLLKTVICIVCLPSYSLSMEHGSLKECPRHSLVTVEFSNQEKIQVPLVTLQESQTLAHFLEDYNFPSNILLPELVAKKHFESLLRLPICNRKINTASNDVKRAMDRYEQKRKSCLTLATFDTSHLINLLNLADFLAIPCVPNLITTILAKKIMHKKEELILFCAEADNTINPEMQLLVEEELLNHNNDIRERILQSYPISHITAQNKNTVDFYSCHNKTLALVTKAKNSIIIYDTSSGAIISTHSFSPTTIIAEKLLRYSFDGEMIAVTLYDKNTKSWYVTLYDVRKEHELLTIEHGVYSIEEVLISPDNKTVIIQGKNSIYFWDIPHKEYRKSIEYNTVKNSAIRYNADGTLIAIAAHDCCLKIQDIKTKNIIHTWPISMLNNRDDINILIFNDTTINVFYKNNVLRIYNFYGTLLHSFIMPYYIDNLYYSSGSCCTIGSLKKKCFLWDALTGAPIRNFKLLSGNPLRGSSLSPDGNTLITRLKHRFTIYNLTPINNLLHHISLSQIMLLGAVTHKVITLTDVQHCQYLRQIKESLPFDIAQVVPDNSLFARLKSFLP